MLDHWRVGGSTSLYGDTRSQGSWTANQIQSYRVVFTWSWQHQHDLQALEILLHVHESREITVSRLEPDELREERKRLVGGAHGNGAREGADDCDHAKYEVKYGHSPTDSPSQGCLGGLKKTIHVPRVYIYMVECMKGIRIRWLWCWCLLPGAFRLLPTLLPPWRLLTSLHAEFMVSFFMSR